MLFAHVSLHKTQKKPIHEETHHLSPPVTPNKEGKSHTQPFVWTKMTNDLYLWISTTPFLAGKFQNSTTGEMGC